MRKIDLSRHMPPGLEETEERNFFRFSLSAATVYSMLFFIRFFSALSELYAVDRMTRERVLLEDAVMTDFAELYSGLWRGYAILAAAMIFFILRHYLYHRRGTKSIYLMRRLPNRWELHRRCLTLPAAGMGICLLAAVLTLVLYFGFYMLVTPDVCIAPGQWQKIWRIFV